MDPQLVVENESGKSMHLIDFFIENLDQNRMQIIDFFFAQLNADKLLYDNLDLLHKNVVIQDKEEISKIEFLLKKRIAINFLNYDAKNILKENKDSCDSVTIDDKLVKCYSEIFQEFKNLSKILISQFINVDGKIRKKHMISINNKADIDLLRFCSFFESLEKTRLPSEVYINIEDQSKISGIIEDVQKINGENGLKISINNTNISKDDISDIFDNIKEGARITYINFVNDFKDSETKYHLENIAQKAIEQKVLLSVILNGDELLKDRKSSDPATTLQATQCKLSEKDNQPQL